YQIEQTSIHALLRIFDHLAKAPEWLLDVWLLRIERALDLEAEHGAYLDGITGGLPAVQRLLRGDERIGWELRFAHDLASDPQMYEPAAALFERCARATEAGGTTLAWSLAASAAAPPPANLDVHWLAALSNPTGVMAPWLALAEGLMLSGHPEEGFAAACKAITAATAEERPHALSKLLGAWRAARITTPIDGNQAFEAGLAAISDDRFDIGIQHLRWAVAVEPGNAK